MDTAGDAVTDAWYFYASLNCEYFCRFSTDDKIPQRFHGPYDSKSEAIEAYREWKVEQMEPDAYEYVTD